MKLPPMYRNMVALDRVQHRDVLVNPDASALDAAASLNSVFLNMVEFADACREFPIVFVRGGEPKDGKPAPLAPLAVLGLTPGENLFIADGKWTADYAPAYVRRYPFCMARIDGNNGESQLAVCIDDTWSGFSKTEGRRLFDEQSEPTEYAKELLTFLENFEQESERTQLACNELEAAGILEEMRFEAQIGDGPKLEVNGFLAVNAEKLAALPDEKVLAFHRNGLLQLIEMHRLSLANMGRLAAKRNKT